MQFKSECHRENVLMESCGCVVTFSPGVLPLLPTTQVFSALDILDYILQLFFGKHMERLPRLYCCQLQGTQMNNACMKHCHSNFSNKNLKWVRNDKQTSMLVALSFSSITCFRMVRDDLMASFNVMDCQIDMDKEKKIQTVQFRWFFLRITGPI